VWPPNVDWQLTFAGRHLAMGSRGFTPSLLAEPSILWPQLHNHRPQSGYERLAGGTSTSRGHCRNVWMQDILVLPTHTLPQTERACAGRSAAGGGASWVRQPSWRLALRLCDSQRRAIPGRQRFTFAHRSRIRLKTFSMRFVDESVLRNCVGTSSRCSVNVSSNASFRLAATSTQF